MEANRLMGIRAVDPQNALSSWAKRRTSVLAGGAGTAGEYTGPSLRSGWQQLFM